MLSRNIGHIQIKIAGLPPSPQYRYRSRFFLNRQMCDRLQHRLNRSDASPRGKEVYVDTLGFSQQKGTKRSIKAQKVIDFGPIKPILAHFTPINLTDMEFERLVRKIEVSQRITSPYSPRANHINVLAWDKFETCCRRKAQQNLDNIISKSLQK